MPRSIFSRKKEDRIAVCASKGGRSEFGVLWYRGGSESDSEKKQKRLREDFCKWLATMTSEYPVQWTIA